MIRVALATLGCKLNQAESEMLAWQLADAGYRVVSPEDGCDVFILNTCTVTRAADSKSRQRLRLAHRQNPGALIVAAGCYAERAPGELTVLGVGLGVGNRDKPRLVEMLPQVAGHNDILLDGGYSGLRTRAFVKVQDGCSRFCAYCIVPRVRGAEKSRPADEVIAELRRCTVEGYREVVLTGTEIGAYQDDKADLAGLLGRILGETGINRLRISSLQPQELSPEFLRLWQDPRLCRHFHLSLQSGSDTVLGRMGRRYTTGEYRQALALIHSQMPEAAVTTDVIVGFPGESDEEFQQSLTFCREAAFARIHVFPYSPRPGTVAAGMPHQVVATVKKQRGREMLALARESALNFRRCFSGEVMAVLWEQQSGGFWSGHTSNYIKVYTTSEEDLAGRMMRVELGKAYRDGVRGRVMVVPSTTEVSI